MSEVDLLEVVADRVDETYIYYECPCCWTIQGGRVVKSPIRGYGFYKSARPTIHKHGSGGSWKNRIEYRGSHCFHDNRQVKIIINDTTRKPVIPVMMNKKQKKDTNAFLLKFS